MPSGDDMDSAQEMSNQDKELAGEVMDSLGEPREAGEEINESHESVGHENTNDPLYVQKRLKQQKRAHDREMREVHARMAEMQSQMSTRHPQQNQQGETYANPVDEQIHKAVGLALHHRDMEEQKAKDAENQSKIHRQYQDLHKHLDHTADKYDDFEDVVRGPDAQFTHHMRDAALLLPKTGAGSAGEVLYKLGKNPEELSRISKLHSLDQAAEMVKLSHALISGGESKGQQHRHLGNIKSNPVTNTAGVTDRTPVSDIRSRMKAGRWK